MKNENWNNTNSDFGIEDIEKWEREGLEAGIVEKPEEENRSLTLNLSELMQKQFPPIVWLVENFIPNGGLIALSGAPNSYKSFFALYIALKVARGEPIFDRLTTTKSPVLIIDKENIQSLIQSRCKLFNVSDEEIHFINKEFFIEDDKLFNEVCLFIKEKNIKLIIFDSFIRMYRGKDENSSNDMAEVFDRLRRFQDAGATILLIHHDRKKPNIGRSINSETMRGSSDILAAVDSRILLEANGQEVSVIQTKLRQSLPIKPFKFRVNSDQNSINFEYVGEIEEEKHRAEKASESILLFLGEGEKTRQEIIGSLRSEFGVKAINTALRSFTSEQVYIRKADRGRKFYSLANDVSEQPELDIPF